MDVDEVSVKLADAGRVMEESVNVLQTISMNELSARSTGDEHARIIKMALILNSDYERDLYLHQYQALYELAKGNDVLLIYPCGSGKTRVLENAPCVAKLGFELRSGREIVKIPLGIVCCPLTAIMEDKIGDKRDCGMLSMYGGCKSGSSIDPSKVTLSKDENDFFTDKLSLIFGHPESFATELGKKVLECNEHRIFVFVTDELGFNIWGPSFRLLMSTVPASIRVFSDVSAPMLCMSATVGKLDQQKVLEDMGMKNRNFSIIDKNPVMPHLFISKLKRPSNQKGFCETGGLKDILSKLFLDEFIRDPKSSRKAIIFCKNEEDLIKVYEFIEKKIGDKHKNLKTRPWIQYHGSMGENTLKWIHHRIKSAEKDQEIKLFLSTYKLVMGVDIQNVDIAIFIRFVNILN